MLRVARVLKLTAIAALAMTAMAAPAHAACPGDLFPACPPNDPGWDLQWNFADTAGAGVRAMGAWQNLALAGRPGATGEIIAVVDSGVAYRDLGSRFRRSPDFLSSQFVPGHDFVDGDRIPLDLYGHGTHIAGTIGEQPDNGIGVTGLAYGAKIMPVRVLDRHGEGTGSMVAKGIRFAASHGADVINLSLDDSSDRSDPGGKRHLRKAIAYANRHGAILVAAAGNDGRSRLPLPARAPHVISVGATTSTGRLASYSNRGSGVDIMAPGGLGPKACDTGDPVGLPIYQMTLRPHHTNSFDMPHCYYGTSMAAAHVSAIAAMVIASGVLGPSPTADKVRVRLEQTAQAIPAGANYSTRYGRGVVDADAATT